MYGDIYNYLNSTEANSYIDRGTPMTDSDMELLYGDMVGKLVIARMVDAADNNNKESFSARLIAVVGNKFKFQNKRGKVWVIDSSSIKSRVSLEE
jgi:hypothetical protein